MVTPADRDRGPVRIGRTRPGARENLVWPVLAAAVFIIVGLVLYSPLFSPTPTIDDGSVVFDNPAVRGTQGWWSAPFYAETFRPLWRPFATWTLRWNRSVVGADKPGFQTVNLLLLAAACFLVFECLRRIDRSPWGAFLVSGLLLIHPANTESVLRLAGRSELLATVLILLALRLYVGGRNASATTPWVIGSLLFALGLLSHEVALLLPVLLIGWALLGPNEADPGGGSPSDSSARRALEYLRRRWTSSAAVGICIAMVVFWLAVRASVIRHWPAALRMNPPQDYLGALSDAERMKFALALPLHYARMATGSVLPDYSHLLARPPEAPAVVLGDPRTYGVSVPGLEQVIAGLVLLLAALALALVFRRRAPLAALGGWILFFSLLFALPLIKNNGQVASARHLFFPLLGTFLILWAALRAVSRVLSNRWQSFGESVLRQSLFVLVPAALLTVVWSVETLHTGASWRTPDAVIDRLAAKAPLSPEIPLQKAAVMVRQAQLARAGKDDEAANQALDRAAEYYQDAIGLFPRMPRALLNLGVISAERQRAGLAGRALADAAIVATRVHPNTALESRIYVALGTYFGEQGMDEPALKALLHAIEADSTNAQALARAGIIESATSETARQAARHLARAVQIDNQVHTLGSLGTQARETLRRLENVLRRADVRNQEESPDSLRTSSTPDGNR